MYPIRLSQYFKSLRRVWYFFISIRLALVLIFIIIILSFVGIFLSQVPREINYGSTEYRAWLENIARQDFGIWTDTLAFFGLFNVFRSPLFLCVGTLLMVNILCCSISRLNTLKVTFCDGDVTASTTHFNKSPFVLYTESSVSNSVLSVSNILLKQTYRIQTEKNEDSEFISADKYAISRLGSLVSHLSLILLVIGFLISSFAGFRDDSFVVVEGDTRDIGHNTGLTLKLVDFNADYWSDGTPREYRSDVVVYKEEKSVKNATIRVNHPLTYEGVHFYQSFYGPAVVMKVTTITGTSVANVSIPLIGLMNAEPYQRPLGKLDLPGTGLTAYLVSSAVNMYDPILQTEQIGIEVYEYGANVPVEWAIMDTGTTKNLQNLIFTYVRQASFSGLIVKYDPGTWLVWLALGLFLVGTITVLYLPFHRLHIMIKMEEKGSKIYLYSSGGRGFDTTARLERFVKEVVLVLPGQLERMEREEG